MVSKPKVTVAAFAVVGLTLLAGSMRAAGTQTGNWNNLANGFPGNGNAANVAGQVPATSEGRTPRCC
jgi:hypothetical protein